jgi:hypothetical protein
MISLLKLESNAEEGNTVDKELLATDKCDRCFAQAYVRVLINSGELLFCGHHYAKHEENLKNIAIKISDQRFRLSKDYSDNNN